MASESSPPPASVRDDLSVLGLCAAYECTDPAVTTERRQPGDLGGFTLDVPVCEEHAEALRGDGA